MLSQTKVRVVKVVYSKLEECNKEVDDQTLQCYEDVEYFSAIKFYKQCFENQKQDKNYQISDYIIYQACKYQVKNEILNILFKQENECIEMTNNFNLCKNYVKQLESQCLDKDECKKEMISYDICLKAKGEQDSFTEHKQNIEYCKDQVKNKNVKKIAQENISCIDQQFNSFSNILCFDSITISLFVLLL